MNSRMFAFVAVISATTVLACSDKKPVAQLPLSADGGTASVQVATDGGLPPSQVTKVDYVESDFVDSENNRDPFRSFASLFEESKKEKKSQNQRNVLLSQFGLDELKLMAIVNSGDYPRAMVIDPAGKGWVLKRGDFLGRAENVHVGGSGGSDYQLNWRVDRVRTSDVVLIREDPAQPNIPPATRVLSLHPEGEPKAQME